jgi:hypothetical protein
MAVYRSQPRPVPNNPGQRLLERRFVVIATNLAPGFDEPLELGLAV